MRNLILFTSIFLIFYILSSLAAAAADTLNSGQNLTDGDTLLSAGNTFALGFFSPDNSKNRYVGIWYSNITVFTVVWVANRQSPITAQSTGALKLTSTGSLLLTSNQISTPLWSTAAAAAAPEGSFVAQLLDSGNFVVRRNDSNVSGEFIWQSFDHPTDTLLAGMKFGPDLRSGLSRSLTSWAGPSDPSPGKYTMAIDLEGVPQLIIKSEWAMVWRGGPWNGAGFVGAASELNYDTVSYMSYYRATRYEIYYSYDNVRGVVTRVVIGGDGMDRHLIWFDPPGYWGVLWSGPNDACDRLSACGAYSVCDISKYPSLCSCLPGFESNSGACVRTRPLRCDVADGFAAVNRVKLPDTSAAMMEGELDLESCRERCLRNCSCTAYARANVTAGGRGCIMWSSELTDMKVFTSGGQDLYVRLAATGGGKKNKSWIFIIVAATVTLLLIASFICFKKLRRAGRAEGNSHSEQPALRWNDELSNKFEVSKETSSDFFLFQFSQIAEATENFAPSNKLGEGGFGPVYKGKLLDGQYIAVKRLSARSGQGLEEFKNEISLIAKLQHRNLVRLLGCCFEGEEKLLVYEYMSNKSLDLFLFDPNQKAKLDWATRFQIIEGIVQGLLYLHKHSRLTIIHRDLKASNILLDDDLRPKISDFGMARIFSSNESELNATNKVVGTYGYISPEYAMKGHFSTKSDVFSFGVLMLEIITGKRNSGFHQHGSSLNLLAYAWELWRERRWVELADDSLGRVYPLDELSKYVHVALLCVQERAVDRPSTSDLLTMLISDNAHLSYPNQPAFFMVEMAARVRSSPISINKSHSLNEITITGIDGR
ncbi:Receptor-like serine/threonine-protein kinase SD1-7 [Platanthera zijinensis]|uniref:Receptor-like serine/threonine-protein kinase n=1 Tax=Platanthera zijinensis TaxID=2320716 RepID=A0AAP0BL16_9ASPA